MGLTHRWSTSPSRGEVIFFFLLRFIPSPPIQSHFTNSLRPDDVVCRQRTADPFEREIADSFHADRIFNRH